MREILFRGKRADNGEWIEGGILQTENWASIYVCKDYQGSMNEPPCCDVEEYEVIPETVGQYTSLTDKNGKKIFEGDIIRTKKYGKIVGNSTVNDYDTFKVIYAPALFRIENMHRGFNLVGNGADYEVIGNIHDNPELLERSKGND